MIGLPTDQPMRHCRGSQSGFSLLELGIVLIVLGLLASSLLQGFSALRESAEQDAARRQLDIAQEALLGFASRHGRLPCPAAPGTSGTESPDGGGNCSNPWDGFLPAISLGIQPVNDHGYAIDPWGNAVRYAISTFKNPACGTNICLSSENGVRNAWNSEYPPAPDLRVCSSAGGSSGSAGTAECASGHTLTKDAVAIIFSLGKNGQHGPLGNDEIANGDKDRLFVSHANTLPPNEFDDQLLWISSNIFYSRLMAAGRLP